MSKYVVFFKGNTSKIIKKDEICNSMMKEMKKLGYRKHHVEVDAENETEAKTKFNEFNNGYLDSLRDLSGNAVICAVSVIAIAIIFLFRLW